MDQKTLFLKPQPITKQTLEELDRKGLIQLFKPTEKTLHLPEGENLGDNIYVSEAAYGPHKLIAVGINQSGLRMGYHPDNEEFFLPDHGTDVKPVYLVISHLREAEFRQKDLAGSLSETDFTCLSLYPCPRGAEMFTMLKETIHCEATIPGEGKLGCFYVTEAADLPETWVDLECTDLRIK